MTNVPVPSRPYMPGYGVHEAKRLPGETFPWSEIEERLNSAKNYWIVTVGTDHRPHAAPVWGAWVGGVLVFDSGRDSKKTRNMLANPEIVIHLEDGDNAVILEGSVRETTDRDLRRRFASIYKEKYEWHLDPDNPPGLVFEFRPRVCLAWREQLGDTAARWTFP